MLAGDAGAKVLAGGQTLGPMLNLRLAQPALLVDITRIPELAARHEDGDASPSAPPSRTRPSRTAASPDPDRRLSRAASPAASPIARCARAAPSAAAWPMPTRRPTGSPASPRSAPRCWSRVPAAAVASPLAGFVRGAMETELAEDELLAAVRIPRFSRAARFGFHKICRKTGEFADAIGVVVADPDRGCRSARRRAHGGRPLVDG